jgi:hypothetical protein
MAPGIPVEAHAQARQALGDAPTRERVILVAERAAALTGYLEHELASNETVACHAGCSWCCTTTYISTSAPEILRLADHLRASLSPSDLAALLERLRRREERISSMPEERRSQARIPCALLVNHRCSVYHQRPVACHGWVSSSAEACERSYRSGWKRQLPNGPRHLGISVGVRQGTRQALADVGLDSARLDLTSALRIALEHSDAGECWLRGEPIFAPAYLSGGSDF